MFVKVDRILYYFVLLYSTLELRDWAIDKPFLLLKACFQDSHPLQDSRFLLLDLRMDLYFESWCYLGLLLAGLVNGDGGL